jgi:hypothetical protein
MCIFKIFLRGWIAATSFSTFIPKKGTVVRQSTVEDLLNQITYGINCLVYSSNKKKLLPSIIYTHEASTFVLRWLDPRLPFEKRTINVIDVKRVEFITREKIPKRILNGYKDLFVVLVKENNESILLFFENSQQKFDFVSALKLLQTQMLGRVTAK